MWYSYLKERLMEDRENVLRLLLIDEEIQGFSMVYQNILSFVHGEYPSLFEMAEEGDTYILEGDSKDFIRLLNEPFSKKNQIIVEETNLGFNKWIYKIYKEFCSIYSISCIPVLFSNTYKITEGRVILIGSDAFCETINITLQVPSVKIKTS